AIRHPLVRGLDCEADHIAAVVLLADDAVGFEAVVQVDRAAAPSFRRQLASTVVQNVAMPVDAEARNHDADVVAGTVALRAGGVDRDDDPAQLRVIGNAQAVDAGHGFAIGRDAILEAPQRAVDFTRPFAILEP